MAFDATQPGHGMNITIHVLALFTNLGNGMTEQAMTVLRLNGNINQRAFLAVKKPGVIVYIRRDCILCIVKVRSLHDCP